jgi:O-antigen/teichoic acid export membrane protein
MIRLYDWLLNNVLSSRKGIEDVIVSMFSQAFVALIGFITSVLLARGLGLKGMGKYALILSVSGLASALSGLGIGQTAIRFASMAAAKNDITSQMAILRWAFRLRMLLVFLIFGLAFVFAPFIADSFWHDTSLTSLVRLNLLTGIFAATAAVPTIYFQSLKRFKMNATVIVGQALMSLVGIGIIAALNIWSLERVIAVSVVATGLGAAAFMILVPKASFFELQEFRQPIDKLFVCLWRAPNMNVKYSASLDSTGANTFAFFMLLSSVIVTLIMQADVWLLGIYVEKSQIGVYTVASRLSLPLVIVLGALNTTLWPRASSLTCLIKTTELIKKTFRWSVLVALAGLFYAIFAPLAIPFIFGISYKNGILLGQILCLRYCIAILTCPIAVISYSFGMVRVYWLINMFQLIAVVAISIFLLPIVGAIGAALALIANEIIAFTFVTTIIWYRIAAMKARQK